MRRRFGVRNWQFSLSATDANRFVIRLARQITGRSKILVHNHCYHGSVDETVATLDDGVVVAARATSDRRSTPRRRRGSSRSTTSRRSSASSPTATSPASCRARAHEHRHRPGRRRLPRGPARADARVRHAAGDRRDPHALLRPGRLHGAPTLEPDLLTIGKPIGGGVPIGAYGLTEEVADRILDRYVLATRPTSAASAGRSPATRSPWRRCARRSVRSSPTRPSTA